MKVLHKKREAKGSDLCGNLEGWALGGRDN